MSDLRAFVDDVLLPALPVTLAYNWPGHEFVESGDRLRGACPFHPSKSGSSFVVTRSSGLWWCQGCATGGDVLSYRYRLGGGNGGGPRGAVFVELLRGLAREAGVTFPERNLSPEERKRAEDASRNRADLEAIYSVAAARLWSPEGDEARAYLHERGLTDDTIREYQLGLAGREVRQEDRGYVILPWRDELGRPLTYYGRWPGNPPEGKPKTTAMPGEGTKRSPIGLDRVRGDEVVVVEGFFDYLVLRQAGDVRVVSGIAGTLPQAAIVRLERRGIRRAIVCGDPDTGGRNGNESNVRRLHAAGIETFVVEELPDGQDPDEFVLSHGIEAWRERTVAALPGWVWIGVQNIGDVVPESHETAKRTVIGETLAAIEGAPRLDREAVVLRLAAATGYTPEAIEGVPREAPPPAPGDPDLRPLLIRDALAEPEPEVSYLLKPLLPVGALLLLASYGGLGKSTLLVQLLASLAAGVPFLGFDVPQAVPTLYLIAEGSRHVFLERVHVAIRRLGLDPATLPLWVSPRGFRPCIGPEVESFIATSGARVVALDTIGLFHDGDENSASDFKAKVVKPLREIMGRRDASFVLVAHQGKPSEERKGRHTIRGSSAMVDDVDVALRLVAPEGDRAPGRILTFDKVRTGESPAPVALDFDFTSATFSRVGDEVLEARQEEKDAAAAEKRMKDLEVAAVRYLKREPDGLTKAELLGELHARKADLVQVLDRLREAGRAFPERTPGSRGLRWRLAAPPTGGSN